MPAVQAFVLFYFEAVLTVRVLAHLLASLQVFISTSIIKIKIASCVCFLQVLLSILHSLPFLGFVRLESTIPFFSW